MRKFLSIFLALCMVFTMLPVSVLADGRNIIREIIAFAPLAETGKSVPTGTAIEGLELPESLMATVLVTIPTDSGDEDSGDTDSGEPLEEKVDASIPVTWTSEPAYDMDTEGVYVFKPVIERYTLIADLPEITVTVAAPMMKMGLLAAGAPINIIDTMTVAQIKTAIETELNKPSVTSVTVTGSKTGVTETLELTIPAGKTVRWGATISTSIFLDALIKLSGGGVFESTGYITASTGTAIAGVSADVSVVVSGGTVRNYCTSTSVLYSVISMATAPTDASAVNVTVKGSGTIYGGTGSAIYTRGSVVVSSSALLYVGGGNTIYMRGTSSSRCTLTIEGGDVTSTSNPGQAIDAEYCDITISGSATIKSARQDSSAGWATITGTTCTLTIKGGTIENTTATGQAIGSMTVRVEIPAGRFAIAKGSGRAMSGAPTLVSATVTASVNYGGSGAGAYNAADIATYKYLMFEPGATAPTITSVSKPTDGTYTAGDVLNFTANFSENVIVNTGGGTPYIPLTIGLQAQAAYYVSGSGTSALVFRYPVQSGDADSDGIACASSVTLNGATVKNAAGNDATLTFLPPVTSGILVNAIVVPSVSINNPSVTEGNSGTTVLTFTVTLSTSTSSTITLDYATADGTATAGVDYTPASGTLTFAPGETSKTVSVTVLGDTISEPGETILLNLENATGAIISNVQGVGTILNDDATVPGAPTAVSATAGDTQAIVSFTSPSSNGGAAITSYTVTSNPSGLTATGAASPITITGLTNGTAYTFTVTATNSVGTGVASVTSNSVTPQAPVTNYNVWVGDVRVTSANLSGSGWSYTPISGSTPQTLTLNGATITTAYAGGNDHKYGIYASGNLKLVLEGDNTIGGSSLNASGNGSSYGIYCYNDLTISGDGSLNVTGGNSSQYHSIGIYSIGSIRITSGTVIAIGGQAGTNVGTGSAGINCGSSIEISGGNITATGGNAPYISVGIYSSDPVTISGGTVTASGVTGAMRSAPTLTNYTRYQWRTTNSGNFTPNTTAAYVWDISHEYMEIKPYTAPITYTITYNANGGTGSIADGAATQGLAFTLPTNSFTAPSGKQFKAWAIGSASGSQVNVGSTYTFTANTTVYAVWEDIPPATYTVTYKPGTHGTGSQTTDTKTHGIALTLRDAIFTRIGFTQTGWATSDGEAKNYDLRGSYTANAAVDLYPVWTARTYNITYIAGANGTISGTSLQTVSHGDSGMSVTAIPNAGHHFVSWSDGVSTPRRRDTCVTSDINLTAKFEANAPIIHIITLNVNGGNAITPDTLTTGANDKLSSLPIPTRGGSYSFDGWFTATSGGLVVTTNTVFSVDTTIYAQWTYTGDSSDGGGGDSDSSSTIVTPSADRPNSPTQGEISVNGTVDGSGNATVNITEQNANDAYNRALAQARQSGNEANGVILVLRVNTGSRTVSGISVNLPKTVQDTIIGRSIANTLVVVDNPDIRIGMDLATIREINRQASADVNITATRTDSSRLTGNARTAIGNRPVFELRVNYGSGRQVQNFGTGSVTVSIPYILGANEQPSNVQAVYVDANGVTHWLSNSFYDSVKKELFFRTAHFSTYGVGYKQTSTTFTDAANHWAKDDIAFVVSRGLLGGTSAATFSPNTALTRGVFVTALGRLANANVSTYKQSSFTDVKNDAYYMGYIEWANKNNILKGVGDGKFAPDQLITREQMTVIMQNYAKATGFALPKVYAENAFADSAKISAGAKDAVMQMQMAGVISGKSGNTFDPQVAATRAEVSAVLRRMVNLTVGGDTMQGWRINDSGQRMYYENGKPVTGNKNINGTSYTFDQYGVTADRPKKWNYTTIPTEQKDDNV